MKDWPYKEEGKTQSVEKRGMGEHNRPPHTHDTSKRTNPLYMGTLRQRVMGFMGLRLLGLPPFLSKWVKANFSSKEMVKGL